MADSYNFSLTTFSPSGKLSQIEYALNAVSNGAPSVGIKATNGVVIATEKKMASILYDHTSVSKIESVSKNIGVVYSGLTPDYRILVTQARKIAEVYQLQYTEWSYLPPGYRCSESHLIPPSQLVAKLANVMQGYTQSGGVRPFGVSLLVAGWDTDQSRPYLHQCDPSGAYFPWKATALGKGNIDAKAFLEKRYSDTLELEDAVQTAILTLKESFEGQMNEENIEIGICNAEGFRKLDPSHVKDYLSTIL